MKAARSRARMTQEQAAQAAGITLRTWGSWERAEVLSVKNEARVRDVLGRQLDAVAPPSSPLDDVSDALLLAEIARRFERGKQAGHVSSPSIRAEVSSATSDPEPVIDDSGDPTLRSQAEEFKRQRAARRGGSGGSAERTRGA